MTDLDQVMKLVRDINTRTIDIKDQLKEMNGTIARHNEELFGNQNSPGVIKKVEDLHDFVVSTKSATKVLVTIVSIVGVGNIILIISLVSKVGS